MCRDKKHEVWRARCWEGPVLGAHPPPPRPLTPFRRCLLITMLRVLGSTCFCGEDSWIVFSVDQQ